MQLEEERHFASHWQKEKRGLASHQQAEKPNGKTNSPDRSAVRSRVTGRISSGDSLAVSSCIQISAIQP